MTKIYLLTTGDGSYGNEWGVQGIYSTRNKAEEAQKEYSLPQKTIYGQEYTRESEIEEWELDPT
jgi:hypothetical protein